MSEEFIDPTNDEQLLDWAKRFIREVADGRHADRYRLDDLGEEQHVALAQVAPMGMRHKSSRVRQAAAWVASKIDYLSEDTVPLLKRLLHDRIALVRMAAAWACGEIGEQAIPIVQDLVGAVHDPNDGVQFAALFALGEIGPDAHVAVSPLLRFIDSASEAHIRWAALRALTKIAASRTDVQEVMGRELKSSVCHLQFAAACGFAMAEEATGTAVAGLIKNLESAILSVAFISAWAIGKLKDGTELAVPALLSLLDRMHWMEVEYSERRSKESISVRPDLRRALEQALPPTDDAEYADFRLAFFLHVFRPTPPGDDAWIHEIANHPWYLKIQRRRFGHPGNAAEREVIRDLLRAAQLKLAQRLRKNPTLGLRPGAFEKLPAFIWNTARSIAFSLRRGQERARRRHLALDLDAREAADERGIPTEEETHIVSEIREYVENHLPEEELAVALLRWFEGRSIAETASALGLTKSKVKTREKNAKEKLRRYAEERSAR